MQKTECKQTSAPHKNRRAVGSHYERIAASFLVQNGFLILERNYRCRLGEIDLIAREGDTFSFVEVKYRKDASYGYPAEAVGWKKRERIRKTSLFFLHAKCLPPDTPVRYDVVEILGRQIRLVRNAFC